MRAYKTFLADAITTSQIIEGIVPEAFSFLLIWDEKRICASVSLNDLVTSLALDGDRLRGI